MLKISHLLRSVDLWLRKCMSNLALVYCAAGRVSPLRLARFTHFLTQKSTPLSSRHRVGIGHHRTVHQNFPSA